MDHPGGGAADGFRLPVAAELALPVADEQDQRGAAAFQLHFQHRPGCRVAEHGHPVGPDPGQGIAAEHAEAQGAAGSGGEGAVAIAPGGQVIFRQVPQHPGVFHFLQSQNVRPAFGKSQDPPGQGGPLPRVVAGVPAGPAAVIVVFGARFFPIEQGLQIPADDAEPIRISRSRRAGKERRLAGRAGAGRKHP